MRVRLPRWALSDALHLRRLTSPPEEKGPLWFVLVSEMIMVFLSYVSHLGFFAGGSEFDGR